MRLRRIALAAALVLGAAAAYAAADGKLVPCRLPGVAHEVLCGALERPLDPSRPDGTRIEVNYAVLPALARNKSPDAVFFFAGGPGQSAIDLAGQLSAYLARFANRRDIVLIDQRGTGRSAPLKCEDDNAARPLAEILQPSRQLAVLAACREALQKKPHGDPRFYTTPIAVQDADAVRRALGLARINLMGVSYGTRAVLEYQRQFPDAVRRAVIDGVAPPDMVLPASASRDNQAALDALFAACEKDAICARAYPRLRVQWRELLASVPKNVLVAHPVTGVRERLEVTRTLLLALVRTPLYSPPLAAALPYAIVEAHAGRFEPLAALGASLRAREMTVWSGMHFAVICSEDVPQLAQAKDAPGAEFGLAFGQQYAKACIGWPRGVVPEAYYKVGPAQAATLVLSGGLDPATPPRHGERVAQALGAKARHVVVPNAGHGVMAVGCMREVLYRFVNAETDSDALAVDVSCAQAIPRPTFFVPLQATPGARP